MNERVLLGVFGATVVLVILLVFQYFTFAFMPAINPNTPDELQKSAAIQAILREDLVLVLQYLGVLAILFFINRRVFKVDTRTCIIITVIEMIILLTSLFFWSLNYVNKFPYQNF